MKKRPGDPWPSILGDVKVSKRGLAYARKIWRRMGYTEA